MHLTRLFTFITLFITLIVGGLAAPATAQEDCGETYTVREGNTLFGIALNCGTTVPAILATNPDITDPNALEVGQVIALPQPVNDIDPIVAISPQRGAPGTTVTIIANGFPVNREVTVNMGPDGELPQLTRRTQTNSSGGITTTLTIPDTFDTGNPRWLVTVQSLTGDFVARSFPFFISEDLPDDDDAARFTQTQVYLVNTAQAPADRICAEPITPYTIDIQPTVAPLTAAIESILSTPEYPVEGLYNAFSLSNVILTGIDIDNREATIALSGELITLGNCDRVWMPAQIRQTALQYDTIDSVRILVNGQPIEGVLDRRGDA